MLYGLIFQTAFGYTGRQTDKRIPAAVPDNSHQLSRPFGVRRKIITNSSPVKIIRNHSRLFKRHPTRDGPFRSRERFWSLVPLGNGLLPAFHKNKTIITESLKNARLRANHVEETKPFPKCLEPSDSRFPGYFYFYLPP